MYGQPPRPTLFPYPPLFRSRTRGQTCPAPAGRVAQPPTNHEPPRRAVDAHPSDDDRITRHVVVPRSEEHTSELQSPDHLVSRLLLAKKNKPANDPTISLPHH